MYLYSRSRVAPEHDALLLFKMFPSNLYEFWRPSRSNPMAMQTKANFNYWLMFFFVSITNCDITCSNFAGAFG